MNSIKSINTTTAARFFCGGGAALRSAESVLQDCSIARIATAYFEPSGWKCLRNILSGKEVRLLIGRPDTAEDRVAAVIEDFFSSLNTGSFEDRISVMQELRGAIAEGRFLVGVSGEETGSTVLTPKYLYHHAKLYIGDLKKALITSANFTWSGLIGSREAGIVSENPEDVAYFAERFDFYFSRAVPLAELLLERLDEWLRTYSPFEIYMLSLISLYGLPSDEKPGRLPPLAGYQRPVVSRLIRNIEDFGGTMLVASTGLGKTIMAAHVVANLRSRGLIDSAIVLCPSGLKAMWQRTMRASRVSSIEFSYYVMSVEDWRRVRDVAVLEREIRHADSNTIIILDESHHLRNAENAGEIRLRHERILSMVGQKARVLLMTATPYSKSVEDINSQLRLLPLHDGGQSLFGGQSHDHWRVQNPQELSELKCGVVLTAPSVVRHFSSRDENGNRYVVFNSDEKRYFPGRINISNIEYHNPVDEYLSRMLSERLLYVRDDSDESSFSLFGDFEKGIRRPLFEAHLVHRLCSSLGEAEVVLEKMCDVNGFEKMRFERCDELKGLAFEARRHIQKSASEVSGGPGDEKIRAVIDILKKYEDEKAVIFCVYKATADYIVSQIEKYMPGTGIKSTVNRNADELEQIIQEFAPVANSIDLGDSDEPDPQTDAGGIRVLVATTAMSEGFNFQDASIMINFDLPWTVLVLAQRMGRILRPWKSPRDINIFTLIPSTMSSPSISHALNWNRRLHQRNRDFSSFADIPVIVERSDEFEMFDLARTMKQFDRVELNLDEVYSFIEKADGLHTSGFLDDLASLSDDDFRVLRRLPDGVRSFKEKSLESELLYMLIRFRNANYPALFDESGKLIVDHDRIDDIMGMIRSSRDETCSLTIPDVDRLDGWHDRAIQNWALAKDVSPEEITVRCLMVLK